MECHNQKNGNGFSCSEQDGTDTERTIGALSEHMYDEIIEDVNVAYESQKKQKEPS